MEEGNIITTFLSALIVAIVFGVLYANNKRFKKRVDEINQKSMIGRFLTKKEKRAEEKKNEENTPQAERKIEDIKQSNICSTKERLEKKWWHRLIMVVIWLMTGGVFIYSLVVIIDEFSNDSSVLFVLLLSPIVYFILRFVYWFITKIILYIAYGKKTK